MEHGYSPQAKYIVPTTLLLCLSALLLSCAVLHKTAITCCSHAKLYCAFHYSCTLTIVISCLLSCALLHNVLSVLLCSTECGLLCFCCAAQVRLTSGSFPCSGPTNLSTAPHNPRPPTSSSPPPPPSSRTSAVSWATSPCPAV